MILSHLFGPIVRSVSIRTPSSSPSQIPFLVLRDLSSYDMSKDKSKPNSQVESRKSTSLLDKPQPIYSLRHSFVLPLPPLLLRLDLYVVNPSDCQDSRQMPSRQLPSAPQSDRLNSTLTPSYFSVFSHEDDSSQIRIFPISPLKTESFSLLRLTWLQQL